MLLNNIEISKETINNELDGLSDSLKTLLFNIDNDIFNHFSFDEEYLEPSLFFYFFKQNQDQNKKLYQQHIIDKFIGTSPLEFEISVDCFKNASIPKEGFITSPYKSNIIKSGNYYYYDDYMRKINFKADKFIEKSNIKLCSILPSILHEFHPHPISTPILSLHEKVIPDLNKAFSNIVFSSPEFAELISSVTKEVSIYNLANTPSFASINYFGTTFINLYNQNYNEIYFMDEIAHQSGHTLFTLLTRNTEDYFIYSPKTLLREFNGFPGEGRNLYGVFHSMFTLCAIIYTLHNYLNHGNFENLIYKELYGRIGFYLDKLIYDIEGISQLDIFSKKGQELYDMFAANMIEYKNSENGIFTKFDYSNQNYYFSIDSFIDLNKEILNEINII